MKKKTFILSLLSLLGITYAQAQTVEFYTPNTVRIVKENGQKVEKTSLVVIASPQKVKVKQTQQGTATIYKSSALTVTVDNGKVSFADSKGNLLTSEVNSAFTPITKGPDQDAFRVRQTFSVEADEGIYGVGLLQNGKMSQRGENRRMEQSNLEDFAHFYQSIKGYGIFWDNYSPTRFVSPAEGQAGEIVLESEVGKLIDYYFIYGGNADGVIAEMRSLSGQVPMFPLWT